MILLQTKSSYILFCVLIITVATHEYDHSTERYFNIHIPSLRRNHNAALQVASVVQAYGTDDCSPTLAACLLSAVSAARIPEYSTYMLIRNLLIQSTI